MLHRQTLPDREPVVSGRFYAQTKNELLYELSELFENAQKLSSFQIENTESIRALVCPHAGYLFSGVVAASAYSLVKNHSSYKRVFLIGSSHHALFTGASVYYSGNYSTPLGKVPVDEPVCSQLLQHSHEFFHYPQAHDLEHTLEVQLPFLQYLLTHKYTIVPIILGTVDQDLAAKIADILHPYFLNSDNLFVFSTDLSHYPDYNNAVKVDTQTIDAIVKNNPGKFRKMLTDTEKRMIPDLATSICGWTSILTLLNITHRIKDIEIKPILYQNSGDIPVYGDKKRVVGYQSMVVTQNAHAKSTFELTEAQQREALQLARESIVNSIHNTKTPFQPDTYKLLNQLQGMGAFVSVYIHNELRGCIGRIETSDTLKRTLHDMAVSASQSDSRFDPIKENELDALHIEISILSPMKKITDINKIVPGRHGILIRKGFHSGTFLPQVAQKTGWNTRELLSKCAEGKAGIGPDGWMDADIFIYEAQVFSG